MSERSERSRTGSARSCRAAARRCGPRRIAVAPGGRATAAVASPACGRRRSERRPRQIARLVAGHQAVAVAGFCGAVDHDLRPATSSSPRASCGPDGDEPRFPGAAMLAGELRRAGLRGLSGPCTRSSGSSAGRTTGGAAPAARSPSTWSRRGCSPASAGRRPRVVRAVVDAPGHELLSPRIAAERAGGQPVAARRGPGPRAVGRGRRARAACCWRRRVASAPASSGPSTSSSGRSSATGRPIYVRRQIIHNTHVVADLAGRGAVFVEELDEVPDGGRVVFAAHGVAPDRARATPTAAACRPSTPPARSSPRCTPRCGASPAKDYQVLLIGHPDHEEVQGTTGEAPAVDRRDRGRPTAPTRSASPIPTGSPTSPRRRSPSTR